MTVPAWLYFVTVLPLAALGGAGVVGLWQWGKIPVTYGSHAAPRTDVELASANVTAARAKLASSLDNLSSASRREFVELGPDPEDDSDDWPAILRGPLDDEDQGAAAAAAVPLRPEYGDPAGDELDRWGVAPLARPYVDEAPPAPELLDELPPDPSGDPYAIPPNRVGEPAPVPFSGGPEPAPPASASGWPATVTVPGSEA